MRRPGWAVLLGAAVLGGCTSPPAPEPTAAPAPEPVAPPAACVLDPLTFSAATGLTWLADGTTASDTRCVYDPVPGNGTDFVAVEVLSVPTALDTVAQACAPETRVPVSTDGFVCRFPGGGVFAARDRSGTIMTVAAAEVPVGSTADQLAAAFAEQLSAG